MTKGSFRSTIAAVLILTGLSTVTAHANPAANKALVEKAMNELFVKRDTTAAERYWGAPYIQHNPGVANGREELAAMIKAAPAGLKYEAGMAVASGDLVMLHGRYSGFGPKALVAVDIFRVANGRIVEHWDVLQDEVNPTKSGNTMFEPKK